MARGDDCSLPLPLHDSKCPSTNLLKIPVCMIGKLGLFLFEDKENCSPDVLFKLQLQYLE